MHDGRATVLVSAARTPVGKFGGALSHLSALDLGARAVREALSRLPIPVTPGHTFLANVVQAGNGQNPARSAAVRGGVPLTVPATTLNDVCLASMTAVGLAATMIRAGELDCALVGGFESMSQAPHGMWLRGANRFGDASMRDLLQHDGLTCAISGEGMGEMSDVVNAELDVSRREQDELAAASHLRAHRATSEGILAREIVQVDDVRVDECIRPDTSVERLAALRPAFSTEGTITAGNASQLSDAAAVGVLMSRDLARRTGLRPLVEVVGRRTIAGPDTSLHLKPAIAAQELLDAHRLSVGDIDLWEINEAFAGVVVAAARALGVGLDQVNINGGAIALGHPLAASGFRLLTTLAMTMVDRQLEHGVATMCGGGGQGQAVLLRLVGP
jgi:acetyl-CoA C-acetyltransferase